MSEPYIPLYRKYRPQKFSDLVGQESVVKTLHNAIELNRVAHAYLFTGPRGTGKTSSARILAKSLNCVEGPTINPCGVCPSCKDISNSNSVDVIEIDAASNRKVEDARNLLEKVQFVPVAGKFKVYIIDEVHMLTTEAFNTLLKTLEEPPKNLVFILATTEAHKVLNTIISRCQRFDFKRVGQDLIAARLKQIAEIENINIDDKALSVIARRSNGGLRDATGLLDQASVLSNKELITENDIIALVGSMSEDNLFDIAQSIADKNTSDLVDLVNTATICTEPVQVIRELVTYFRNLLILKTSENSEKLRAVLDYSDQMINQMKTQSEKFESNEIVQIIEKLVENEKTVKNTSNQYLWLEITLIGICHRQDIVVIKDLQERLEKLEQAISGGAIPVPQIQKQSSPAVELPKPVNEKPVPKPEITEHEPTPKAPEKITTDLEPVISEPPKTQEVKQETTIAAVQSEPAVSKGNLVENWKGVLANIESIPSRTFFLSLAKPVEVSADKITITFANERFVKQSREKGKVDPLEKAAEKFFGVVPLINIRTPIPEDAQLIKQQSEKKTEFVSNVTQTAEKPLERFERKESPKAIATEVVVDKEAPSELDEDVLEEINQVNKDILPINISEQAKMVINLFNGKVIE